MVDHMDVGVFGVQRSGTTMLAGLLTWGNRIMYNEPRPRRPAWAEALDEKIPTLDRWGVKDVSPRRITLHRQRFTIGKVVICIRDIRAILISTHEALSNGARWPRWERQLLYIPRCAAFILSLLDDPSLDCRITHYSELVQSSEERESLGQWLDWPLKGSTTQWQRRGPIHGRHPEGVTNASLLERTRQIQQGEIPGWDTLRENSDIVRYQDRFHLGGT